MITLSDLPRAREVFSKPLSAIVVKERESYLHCMQAILKQDLEGNLYILIRVKSRLGIEDKFSRVHGNTKVDNIDKMNDIMDWIAKCAKEYYYEMKKRGEYNEMCKVRAGEKTE